jgi:aminoglycoside phosphotransferase (APT) family kinase protein
MHTDEIETTQALVRLLLRDQFPEWADLAIEPVESHGTDHAIYRLGRGLAVRLPIIGWATRQAAKERLWLPRLAPHLPVAVPVQVATGQPGLGYPYERAVYEWLPGVAANASLVDLDQAAGDLARFIRALRSIDPAERAHGADRCAT